MKTLILNLLISTVLITMLGIIACNSDTEAPKLPNCKKEIKFREGDFEFYTTSQMSSYANMASVDSFVEQLIYALENLAYDTAAINADTEDAVLFRYNEYLDVLNESPITVLPEYLYGTSPQTVSPTPAIVAIFEDIDQILVDHYDDVEGYYGEFKSYIEGINMGNLNSLVRDDVATALYCIDIALHVYDKGQEGGIEAFGWGNYPKPTKAQVRCAISVVGSAVIGALAGTPVIGILSGFVAWANTDPCWE